MKTVEMKKETLDDLILKTQTDFDEFVDTINQVDTDQPRVVHELALAENIRQLIYVNVVAQLIDNLGQLAQTDNPAQAQEILVPYNNIGVSQLELNGGLQNGDFLVDSAYQMLANYREININLVGDMEFKSDRLIYSMLLRQFLEAHSQILVRLQDAGFIKLDRCRLDQFDIMRLEDNLGFGFKERTYHPYFEVYDEDGLTHVTQLQKLVLV